MQIYPQVSDAGWLRKGNHGVWAGGVPAAEAGGRWSPPPEAEGRRLGLQAPGGRHPLHVPHLNTALSCWHHLFHKNGHWTQHGVGIKEGRVEHRFRHKMMSQHIKRHSSLWILEKIHRSAQNPCVSACNIKSMIIMCQDPVQHILLEVVLRSKLIGSLSVLLRWVCVCVRNYLQHTFWLLINIFMSWCCYSPL